MCPRHVCTRRPADEFVVFWAGRLTKKRVLPNDNNTANGIKPSQPLLLLLALFTTDLDRSILSFSTERIGTRARDVAAAYRLHATGRGPTYMLPHPLLSLLIGFGMM
jgi:hypothetical protein